MKSIERSARANCTAATLRNCGHAQLLLHACGHTCLVSAYMLISHCVNPCTNSKTVHFSSVNECLLHCYFDTYRGICTLVLHYMKLCVHSSKLYVYTHDVVLVDIVLVGCVLNDIENVL